MKNGKHEKGFSLIELIIAIAILVTLTGFLAPHFTKYIEKARWAKGVQALDNIYFTLEIAYTEILQTEKDGNDDGWIDIIDGKPYPSETNNVGKAICESMRENLGDDLMDRIDISISVEQESDNKDNLSMLLIKYRPNGKSSARGDFYYLNIGMEDDEFPGRYGQYRDYVPIKWQ